MQIWSEARGGVTKPMSHIKRFKMEFSTILYFILYLPFNVKC